MKAAKLCLAMMFIPAGAGLMTLTGCGSEPTTVTEQKQLINDSQANLKDLELADPSLQGKVDSAYGYAIFPSVGKGGAGVEVATGNGDVYQGGKFIGQARLGMVGTGIDLGAETYSELILFETPEALNNFENNNLRFDASASAVALKAGAADTAKFEKGVLVFQHTHGGLMVEAGIGGQQFTFKAANAQPATQP
jgi:lipid-binding SYLF domain-containing protein